MSEQRTCAGCPTPLPPQRRGRPKTWCHACRAERARERRNARERQRYAEDPEFREAQLEARRERYQRNVEHERERSRTYYDDNAERIRPVARERERRKRASRDR